MASLFELLARQWGMDPRALQGGRGVGIYDLEPGDRARGPSPPMPKPGRAIGPPAALLLPGRELPGGPTPRLGSQTAVDAAANGPYAPPSLLNRPPPLMAPRPPQQSLLAEGPGPRMPPRGAQGAPTAPPPLLAGRASPPQQDASQEPPGFLRGMLTGQIGFDDPRMQMLLGTGAGMLAASGWSDRPISLGEALGQGVLQGQQFAGAAQDTALSRQKMEAYQRQAEAEAAQAQREQQVAEQIAGQLGAGAGGAEGAAEGGQGPLADLSPEEAQTVALLAQSGDIDGALKLAADLRAQKGEAAARSAEQAMEQARWEQEFGLDQQRLGLEAQRVANAARGGAPSLAQRQWDLLTPEQQQQAAEVEAGIRARPSAGGGRQPTLAELQWAMLSPEQRQQAAEVEAGLRPKPGSGGGAGASETQFDRAVRIANDPNVSDNIKAPYRAYIANQTRQGGGGGRAPARPVEVWSEEQKRNILVPPEEAYGMPAPRKTDPLLEALGEGGTEGLIGQPGAAAAPAGPSLVQQGMEAAQGALGWLGQQTGLVGGEGVGGAEAPMPQLPQRGAPASVGGRPVATMTLDDIEAIASSGQALTDQQKNALADRVEEIEREAGMR